MLEQDGPSCPRQLWPKGTSGVAVTTTSSCWAFAVQDLPATGGEKPGWFVTHGEGQQLHHRFQGDSEPLIALTSSHRRKIPAHRDLAIRFPLFHKPLFPPQQGETTKTPRNPFGDSLVTLRQVKIIGENESAPR